MEATQQGSLLGTLLTRLNNSTSGGSIFFIMHEHTESVRRAVLILESVRLSFAHGQKAAGTFCWSFISCYVSWQSGARSGSTKPGVGKASRWTREEWRTTKGD